MPAKPKKKPTDNRLQIRYDDAWLARVEDWRAKQRPIPSLSEAIRTLTDMGIETELRKRERKR
jgi:hypothetical protein